MKIIIDADGCPVVNITVNIAFKKNIKVIIISDTSHMFDFDNVETITVTKGADSADFVIVNKVIKNDIVVTQDYGLAAMCLAKNAVPINQNGFIYTNENIDNMLFKRHIARQIRKAGGKTANIKKRTKLDDERYRECLLNVLNSMKSK